MPTSPEPVASHRGRIDFIDAIRGIASLIVAVGHALETWYPTYAQWSIEWVNVGRIGIVAFFMVSGYVVGLTLSTQTPRTFLIRRFWRLYPVYWLTTALYAATVAVTGQAPIEYTVFVFAINITMLQGFVGVVSILGPAWTLGIEVAFYLQSACAKLMNRLPSSLYLGYVWFVIFGLLALSNFFWGTDFSGLAPLMLFTASIGYALYLWNRDGNRTIIPMLGTAIFGVPALGWLLGAGQLFSPEGLWPPTGFNISYLAGISLFLVFYAIRVFRMPSVLLYLGSISYALYLIHATVIIGLKGLPLPTPGLVIVVVIVAIAVAAVVHTWVEKPFIAVGRRLSSSKSVAKENVS